MNFDPTLFIVATQCIVSTIDITRDQRRYFHRNFFHQLTINRERNLHIINLFECHHIQFLHPSNNTLMCNMLLCVNVKGAKKKKKKNLFIFTICV